MSYPDTAGFKEGTVSRDAAIAIEATGRATALRYRVLEWYNAGNTGTADDCAAGLDENALAIRPRVSELYKYGVLNRTTEKRRSRAGGRMAWIMKA